jgi:hypothetical protein
MNKPKPKPSSSAIISKSRRTTGLMIEQENSHTLRVQHDPNKILALVGFMLMMGLMAILAYFQATSAFYIALVLLFSLYELTILRPIRCVLDKQTGQLHYFRSGVFGSRYDSQDVSGNIADIRQLEMKRRVRYGGDKCQLILLLDKNERLTLSDSNLGFGECQEFAEKIRDFLGSEIPIKAID